MRAFLILILLLIIQDAMSFIPSAFHASFENSFKGQISGKERKSFGFIDYKFPGNIKFEIDKPDPLIFVANPEKSWYYRPPFIEGEPGELKIGSGKNMLVAKFFDLLRDGIKTNKHFEVKKDKNLYTLLFAKKTAKELGMSEATLEIGSEKDFKTLQSIAIKYLNGKDTLIVLKEIKSEASFKDDHFTFKVPENTVVSQ